MALRVPGRGLASRDPRGRPGDLYVVIRTARDPRFARDGTDLWRVETVEIPDAVLGTSREVPTVDGHATVTIPPGTQPGAVLRLRGKGLPEFGGDGRGDLHLRVQVQVPERLSAEERELYECLRQPGKRRRRRGSS